MISCKTCDHYEEYNEDGYIMYCNDPGATVRIFKSLDSGDCIYHTKLHEDADETEKKQAILEVKTLQHIECTKCGHKMRIEG